MDKKYNAQKVEKKWYCYWLKKGYFKANNQSKQKTFVMIMPPVNVTGELHLGHALQHTITDTLIRFKRMQGYDALWLPGVDHAGIQMQGTMEKKLAKEEGKTRAQIGNKAFLKYIWKWARIYEQKILEQSQALGEAADWSRRRFTLDPGPRKAVQEEFIRLYNEGLIYKGPYIVHYCIRCQTAITDLELEYKEEKGKLYYLRYPLRDEQNNDQEGGITVATTRPETMLGDTAVAVHPDDAKYKKLVGRTLILPLANREIPIIADSAVDPHFGTGAVKVTPAHDLNDYDIGQRHHLPAPVIINREGKMQDVPKKYEGLTTAQARIVILNDLKRESLLAKEEKITHAVTTCERCKSTVEPLISVQWFVKMKELAQPAIKAIQNGEVKFLPKRFAPQALNWLTNIHDWCISRQLVWGHPMPVYYCGCSDKPIVSATKPKTCPQCHGKKIIQEKDVLDTWFSSGLWPFSTLGWPNEKAQDLKRYYPSDVMVTAPEILYLWICRMIMLGIEFCGQIPFRTVFIHGTLRDAQGKKMSKSLGNGVDPLEMIKKYSADSVRFALATAAYPGRDIKMSKQAMEDKIRSSRNFTTKIYNAAKLILENTQPAQELLSPARHLEDQWILSRLHFTVAKVTTHLTRYQIAKASQRLYRFFWNELCDWYLEIVKKRIYGDDPKAREEASQILRHVLKISLTLLHPFVPFITEELYQHLEAKQDLIVASWPQSTAYPRQKKIEQEFRKIQEAVIQRRTQGATTQPLAPSSQALVEFLTRKIK